MELSAKSIFVLLSLFTLFQINALKAADTLALCKCNNAYSVKKLDKDALIRRKIEKGGINDNVCLLNAFKYSPGKYYGLNLVNHSINPDPIPSCVTNVIMLWRIDPREGTCGRNEEWDNSFVSHIYVKLQEYSMMYGGGNYSVALTNNGVVIHHPETFFIDVYYFLIPEAIKTVYPLECINKFLEETTWQTNCPGWSTGDSFNGHPTSN